MVVAADGVAAADHRGASRARLLPSPFEPTTPRIGAYARHTETPLKAWVDVQLWPVSGTRRALASENRGDGV